ncbi:hypothetical protein BH18ACT12_BH18ACT12_17940 [soil metagenome]
MASAEIVSPWVWLVAPSVGMAAGLTASAALVDYGIAAET